MVETNRSHGSSPAAPYFALVRGKGVTLFPMTRSARLSDRFDLVIFDWAGTIVDFGCCAPVVALQQVFSRYGVSLAHEEVRRDMGKAKADHVRALLTDARIVAAWKGANGATPTSRDFDALVADLAPLMREQAELAATLIEGARKTVDTLRAAGLRVALFDRIYAGDDGARPQTRRQSGLCP